MQDLLKNHILYSKSRKRYLTKSRFKLANECPSKLFYTGKDEYANQNLNDNFLFALAEGGYQVNELAKCYFQGGHDLKDLDDETALTESNKLLCSKKIIIYEAAIATENLFIRVDVLVKNKDKISLYEVKSKSFDPDKEDSFVNKQGAIKSNWRSSLYDIAFQKYVIHQAFPQFEVYAYLVMADKSSVCPTEGLNQKFRIVKNCNGRKSVSVSNSLTEADLTPPILCKINVDSECKKILANENGVFNFGRKINLFADSYISDTKIFSPISLSCSSCEFYTTDSDEQMGLKSGKKECWKNNLGWQDEDFKTSTVLDIWNFRKKAKLIKHNRIKISDVVKKDINPKPDGNPGISPSERQWLQVRKCQKGDNTVWLDRNNLWKQINSWIYPFHFIDFETTMMAIPFNSGRRPYEGVAFQFSHHIVQKDGTIEHFGEYLNTERGIFPNYNFLRELKAQLENDSGTIFCYSNHENTFLNMIYRQLKTDDTVNDRTDLCSFIRSISESVKDSVDQWIGDRNMVDMWKIVKRHYYDPGTNGSNSIKDVLPAMLNSSRYLCDKYSEPIYGSPTGIKSLNFKNWQLIKIESGRIIDPYETLPRMFQDPDGHYLSNYDKIKDGGAAMIAYARMQFEEMTDYERREIRKALLRYCELDTMAMVMIYEGWNELLQ